MQDDLLINYDYELPQELIAQYPAASRDGSRLMLLKRNPEVLETGNFCELGQFLPKNSLLVVNDTRVLPARILAHRPGGGKLEFLLLSPLSLLPATGSALADCLLKPAAKVRIGDTLELAENLRAVVLAKKEFGQAQIRLEWNGDLGQIFEKNGNLPLPPYIRRQPESSDRNRYQTIFATKTGAVAAPTASLHFTASLKDSLQAQGIEFCSVTLHVGYGTFSPIRSENLGAHRMHSEYMEISAFSAMRINAAREEGRPVIAVGTTSLRCLEGCVAQCGNIQEHKGWTDIFIYPGKEITTCDGLLTNFHLPRSSLLVLVSAFAGRERILNAYEKAIKQRFRFFSYGDAMLIL